MAQGDRIVKVGNQEIALGGFALLLMLAAIIVPPVMYSVNLRNPTPAELLVAISIGMFASTLYLWVLDATNTLPFRSAWVSRGVYSAAIVSILGTSVGVYKDAFVPPYPYQGEWLLSIRENGETLAAQRPVALSFSRQTGTYWGYGDSPSGFLRDKPDSWLKVVSFDPRSKRLELQVRFSDAKERHILIDNLREDRANVAFSADKEMPTGNPISVQMARRAI
jgi:hypothetical protein